MKLGELRGVLADEFDILLILPRPKTKPIRPMEFGAWFKCDSKMLDKYDEREIGFIEPGDNVKELFIQLEEE